MGLSCSVEVHTRTLTIFSSRLRFSHTVNSMLGRIVLASVVVAVALTLPSGPPDNEDFCGEIPRVPGHGEKDTSKTCPFVMVGLPWVPGQFTQSKYLTIFLLEKDLTNEDIYTARVHVGGPTAIGPRTT